MKKKSLLGFLGLGSGVLALLTAWGGNTAETTEESREKLPEKEAKARLLERLTRGPQMPENTDWAEVRSGALKLIEQLKRATIPADRESVLRRLEEVVGRIGSDKTGSPIGPQERERIARELAAVDSVMRSACASPTRRREDLTLEVGIDRTEVRVGESLRVGLTFSNAGAQGVWLDLRPIELLGEMTSPWMIGVRDHMTEFVMEAQGIGGASSSPFDLGGYLYLEGGQHHKLEAILVPSTSGLLSFKATAQGADVHYRGGLSGPGARANVRNGFTPNRPGETHGVVRVSPDETFLGKPQKGLQIDMDLGETEIHKGASLTIEGRLENVGDKEIRIMPVQTGAHIDHPGLWALIHPIEGKGSDLYRGFHRGDAWKGQMWGGLSTRSVLTDLPLVPGEQRVFSVRIDGVDLEPGFYEIRLAYSDTGFPSRIFTGNRWLGEVVSEPKRFGVREEGVSGEGDIVRVHRDLEGAVEVVRFSPDGRRLGLVSGAGGIELREVGTWEPLRTFGSVYRPSSLAFGRDGKKVVSASMGRSISVWDVETGRELAILSKYTEEIVGLAVSPDGRWLVALGTNYAAQFRKVMVWDLKEHHYVRTFAPGGAEDGKDSFYASVAFSPDGRRLALGGDEGHVELVDFETGRFVRTIKAYTGTPHPEGDTEPHWLTGLIGSVAFCPDGRPILASGCFTPSSEDTAVKLWDVKTGELLRAMEGHADYVREVTFSPDGAWLASASDDGTVRIWGVADGRERQVLGHPGKVRSVAFSPDGKWLVCGYQDANARGGVRIWEVVFHMKSASSSGMKEEGR
jgi:WD40 repeat protein